MAGLETTLQSPVKETKAASVDILLFIVDYSPSLVSLCSPLLFPCEDCSGSTCTNAGARVHDAADQLHRRRRPPHEHCDWGNDLWHRWGINRLVGRKLSHTCLFSASEAFICYLFPNHVVIIDHHQSALLFTFVMITYTQSELQTWARPCSWWGSLGRSLIQRTCWPGNYGHNNDDFSSLRF